MRLSKNQLNIKARKLGILNPQSMDRATLSRKISYRQSHPCKKGKTLSDGICKDLPYKSVLLEYAIYYELNSDVPRDELIANIIEASEEIGDGIADMFDTPEIFPTLQEAEEAGLLDVARDEDDEDVARDEDDEFVEEPPEEYVPSEAYILFKKQVDADVLRDPRFKEPGQLILDMTKAIEYDLKLLGDPNFSDEEKRELDRLSKKDIHVPVSRASDPMSIARRIIQRSRNYRRGMIAYEKLRL